MVILSLSQAQICQRNGIKIVIGESDKSKALAPQRDDFLNHTLRRTLPRPLTVGPPDGTEGAMFRTATNGLDGCPHVFVLRHEIPPRRQKAGCINPAALIQPLRIIIHAIVERFSPSDVAITLHHRMSAT